MKCIHPLLFAAASVAAAIISVSAAQAPVDLGTAGNLVILSKTGVSTTGVTSIVGDIAVSPIGSTAITGFSLTAHSSGEYSTSPLVTGKIFASNYAAPTPSNLTTAVGDMQTAFTDAAGRSLPDTTELGAGNISGMTIQPGLHKWGSGVLINGAVTLTGDANDVWIFQIAQDLTVGDAAIVHLSGGAQPGNIFWQVAGEVNLGTTSHFEGILLVKTAIHLNTGATINGKLLAQTAVTLDANDVRDVAVIPARILQAMSISRAADGLVTLVFRVTPGHAITLQHSVDLVNWTSVSTQTPAASFYTTTQATSLDDKQRFFRAFYQ
jgi:hypothetical protein